MTPSSRPAAFVDRDGTIIRDAAYLRHITDVELLPGAVAAIRHLNDRGVPVIVVTNQSGIARGLLSLEDYEAVRRRLDTMLAAEGARVDGSYMCPHHPEVSGPCDCRKPGLALYRQAIAEHGLDASRSLFVGDRWRDVAPASTLGGRPILLDVLTTPPEDRARAEAEQIERASSLSEAVEQYLRALPDLSLRP